MTKAFFFNTRLSEVYLLTSNRPTGIELIGTLPQWRGYGATEMLVDKTIQLSQQSGFAMMVNATPALWPLYERRGFVDRTYRELGGNYAGCKLYVAFYPSSMG